jgi:hypothetical protein
MNSTRTPGKKSTPHRDPTDPPDIPQCLEPI